jgi:two-component system phosphate regulon sensor histidine kinase PhoR
MIPEFILVLLALGLLWLGWKYLRLRRAVNDLTAQMERGDELVESASELSQLASLRNARHALLRTQLASSETHRSRLSAILDQLTDGVLIADSEGYVQFANPAADRLFAHNSAGLTGLSVTEALRYHQLVETWRKCHQSGVMHSETVEIPTRRQFLQIVAMPDTHSPGGSLLLVQDLTRLRRLETVRRDFISNISHEIRTPLASLKALTETLQDGALDDPPAARRFLQRISTEVDALTQMAQELLDLSRIESGQVSLEMRRTAPGQLLQSAADRMRMQAERARLSLHVDCNPELPDVKADPPRVEQVLVNLIHNAVKFTDPGGEVRLSAARGEGTVIFAVKDSGAGIPSDDLPRIFERFYKADRARSGGGTGLGLSIARHIVEAHGGRIWAESEEGCGSTFYFTLASLA